MSKTEPTTTVGDTTTPYAGIAIQKANIRMHKLSHTMRELKAIVEAEPDITPVEATKILYEDWENLTLDQFEGKTWYVEEKLLPLLNKDPKEVYTEALEEEQAKLLSIDDAQTKFTW